MTRFTVADKFDPRAPLAAVVFQGEKGAVWSAPAKKFPQDALKIAREDGFQGKAGGSFIVRAPGRRPVERLILWSAGKPNEANLHSLRKLGATVFKRASDARIPRVGVLLTDELGDWPDAAQAVVEGFLLGGYRFTKHKSRPAETFRPAEVTLVVPAREKAGAAQAVRRAEVFADAVNFARDLINEPPSLKVPQTLGKVAAKLAGGRVRARVYQKGELARMKMNALLGVNRGSAHPPVLVHLRYKPAGRPRRKIAFVGKGITFDSGGLSLKTADGMMTMKYDMSGAASVMALIRAAAKLNPAVELHAIAPITENMPGHDAYKPGDVVRASNGRTIEVLNTDAEGRIVLSDALAFAAKLDVDEIIDIATLTGAVTIALGKAYAAIMSNNDSLFERLRASSEKSGEKIWRLPLEPSYRDHIRSKVADLKNIGNPGEAGTIVGGLFLQEFVNGKTWAHFDIAGAGWSASGGPLGPSGATGVIIRTLLHYILS